MHDCLAFVKKEGNKKGFKKDWKEETKLESNVSQTERNGTRPSGRITTRQDASEVFLSFPFKQFNNLWTTNAWTSWKHKIHSSSLLALFSSRLSSTIERCNSIPLLSLKLFHYYRLNKQLLHYHCYYDRVII